MGLLFTILILGVVLHYITESVSYETKGAILGGMLFLGLITGALFME